MISRTKLTLRGGRTVYVYGRGPWNGIARSDIASSEDAGFYDPRRNVVTMTEPTSMHEGRLAPGA